MLAVMVLGDRVVWGQWGLVALGHIGVLIMMRPGSENFDPAIIVALFANFFASAAIIIVKKLSTTESTLQILFYTNVVSVLLMSILAGFLWETPSQHDLIILCVIGATGTFSQFCYIQSLKLSDPSFVAPFEYSRLVFAIPIGLIFFAEIPTNWDIAGSFVIISSNFLLTLFKLKREK
jgi:drug/metabolite transporter (DMT)-like permease